MDDRVRIRKSILQGNIQKAIALVNALDASVSVFKRNNHPH